MRGTRASFGPINSDDVLGVSSEGPGEVVMGRVITVSGTGVAHARPDRVRFDGRLAGRCGTYAEALEESGRAVRSLKKAVGDAGFDMDDLRSSGISVRAVYAEKERKGTRTRVFDGYEYSHRVSMVADLGDDCIGRLMDALTGCEGAPVFDVAYGVSDPTVPQSEARRLAVEDARRSAEQIAEAAGVSLGRIVSMTYGRDCGGMRCMSACDCPEPEDEVFEESVLIKWSIGERAWNAPSGHPWRYCCW